MADLQNLGDDSVGAGKIAVLLLATIGIAILAWYSVNIPEFAAQATKFWILGLTALLITGISLVIKRAGGADFPNPIIHEKSTLVFGEWSRKRWLLVVTVLAVLSLYLFFSIGGQTTAAIMSAPSFQVIEPTPALSAFMSVFAAIMEDLFFWGLMPALTFVVIYALTRNSFASLIAAFALNPFIFATYHTLVYGATSPISTAWVFGFGMLMTSATLLLRSLVVPLFIHASNNAAIIFFSGTAIIGGMFWFVALSAIVLISGGWLYLRSGKA